MNASEKELWSKIDQFEIDKPKINFTFSQRLAKENNLPLAFAKEIALEYKKFMFLCAVSGKMVSPSYYVDMAWHLHLTYTKSYWHDLCRDILGKEIHHYPTEGGKSENFKFKLLYCDTLKLYVEKFGYEPVTKIWKSKPMAKIAPNINRVNRPILNLFSNINFNFKYLIVLIIPFTLFGCENIISKLPNFLFWFIFLIVIFSIFFRENKNRSQTGRSNSDDSGTSCSSTTLTDSGNSHDAGHSCEGNDDGNGDGGSDGGGDGGGSSCGGGCSGGGD